MNKDTFIHLMCWIVLVVIVLRAFGYTFSLDLFFQKIFKYLRALDWLLMIFGWATTAFFTEKLLIRIGIENNTIIIISIVLASIVYFYFVMQYFLMMDSFLRF